MTIQYQAGDEPVPGSGYRLVEFLGRGGFGEVWKASAPGGAEAALKIIRLGGQEGRKEFRALQLVKRIRHAHLVPIIAFWLKGADGSVLDNALTEQESAVSGNTPAVSAPLRETRAAPPDVGRAQASELIIAMGLGDRSLWDRLEECRRAGLDGIPRYELLEYLEGAAQAIDFLNSPTHNLGEGPPAAIQHCDIKPQNIMIVGGATQVCDFGLARMMGADRTTTAAATVAYAAPECLEEGTPSASTDQYSLAVSYFELCTGRLPYSGETLVAVMEAKRQGGLDFSGLSAAEQAVLRRATAHNPTDRFDSATAMVRALLGVPTESVELVRPKRYYLARGVALVALVGLVAWGIFRWVQRDGRIDLAKQEANAADCLARGTELLQQGNLDAAITALIEAARHNPNDPRAFSRLGAAFFGKKEWNKAVEHFTRAIWIDPNDTDYVSRGRAYQKLGRSDDALDDFDAAVRLNAENAAAYVGRGDCRLDGEDTDGAVADFSKAIDICSQSAEANLGIEDAYIVRALTYLAMGNERLDQAAEDFSAALRQGNTEQLAATLHQRLGQLAKAYADQGQFTKAVAWASKAVELAPDDEARTRHQADLDTYRARQQ